MRGVARALARHAVDAFTRIGVAQVRLHTAAFNDAARATFAAEGFRACVVEMLRVCAPHEGTEEGGARRRRDATR